MTTYSNPRMSATVENWPHPQCRKWVARITAGKRTKYLGLHQTQEEAHAAYCTAAAQAHGNFARFK